MSAEQEKPDPGVDLPPVVLSGAVSNGEAVELARQLNVCPLPRSVLTQLKERGIELDNEGVTVVGNQMIYVTAEVLLKAILLIGDELKTADKALKFSTALTSLAKAMKNLTDGLSETLQEKGGNAPVASKAKAFPGGGKTNLTQINFHPPAAAVGEQKT